MNRAEVVPDNEDSVTCPRLVPLSGLVVAAAGLLQWLLPIDILSDLAFVEDVDPLWLEVAGLIIALAGLSLSVAGHFALTRRGADARSRRPATMLVVDGVFQWTRNPGCLGMLIGLFGIALVLSLDWLLILIVPLWLFLNSAVIGPEELHLQYKFGRAYLVYARRVPRYVFIH